MIVMAVTTARGVGRLSSESSRDRPGTVPQANAEREPLPAALFRGERAASNNVKARGSSDKSGRHQTAESESDDGVRVTANRNTSADKPGSKIGQFRRGGVRGAGTGPGGPRAAPNSKQARAAHAPSRRLGPRVADSDWSDAAWLRTSCRARGLQGGGDARDRGRGPCSAGALEEPEEGEGGRQGTKFTGGGGNSQRFARGVLLL